MNENQKRLAELLKKKGIGPAGSKSLKEEELTEVGELFKYSEVSITTKATMLTALLLLDATDIELQFINKIKENPDHYLPEKLVSFLEEKSHDSFLQLIRKNIARKDLTEEECMHAMDMFFGQSEDYMQAAFLEAQRLKRETFIENKSFFDSFWNQVKRIKPALPQIVDICNNYDGNIRTKNYTLLTTRLLAEYSVKTLVHGVNTVAPKQGLTTHQILKKLGYNPLLSFEEATETLNTKSWAYIGQEVFFPELFRKVQMRKEMVKRPFIATFEKLMQPIQSEEGNLVVTGFTHKHYKQEVPKLLKEQGECAKALVVKGEEGSAQLPLHKASEYVFYDGHQVIEGIISPEDFGIELLGNTDKSEVNAENVIQNMEDALSGKNQYVKNQVIYNAAAIIKLFKLGDSTTVVKDLEKTFSKINSIT